MTRTVAQAWILVGLMILLAAPQRLAAENTPIKVQVKTLEIGYRLATGKLRVRVNLTSGDAVDFEPGDHDKFLEIAKVFASGHARLYVELEDGKVASLDIAIP